VEQRLSLGHVGLGVFVSMAFAVTSTVGYLTPEARTLLEQNDCQVTERELEHVSEAELCRAMRGIDVVIAGGDYYTAKVLEAADRLKIIARVGAGYDRVDVQAASRCRIWVTTPGANSDAVADLTLGLMLCLLRNIPAMAHDMTTGRWNQFTGRELGSMAVGIVGTGSIGQAVIRRLSGFGCRLVAYDVLPDHDFARCWNVNYVALDDLVAQSDIISLNVALNDTTKHLIDGRRLTLMKKRAYLINTSRPGVVDKQALVRALQARGIAGAAIDVHDPAPCAPDDPLVWLDNVVATPWVAYKTEEAIARMCISAAQEVVTVLQGGRPIHPVNSL
jgi:D-3-phosphoglycerate dehydrogenase / 2-oxoglutarate reductase